MSTPSVAPPPVIRSKALADATRALVRPRCALRAFVASYAAFNKRAKARSK